MISILPPHPAALIKIREKSILAVADLHIGWELGLSEKGIHVPTQTPRLLKALSDLISEYHPDELLILGDVKHTVAKAEMSEWRDVPDFFAQVEKQVRHVKVLRGNHDGNLEPLLTENVELLPANGVALNDVGVFHGHQWPSPTVLASKTLVMGHVHPVVGFRDPAGFRITRQVWIRADCNRIELTKVLLQKQKIRIDKNPEKTLREHFSITPKTSQLFIMPSFNEFLGGRPLNDFRMKDRKNSEKIVGPVLRSEAVKLESAETFLLDGTFLGSLGDLSL